MITFKISFLLGFNSVKKLPKKRNQNNNEKATNVKEKKKKLVPTVEDTSEVTYDASNIVGAAHIQYELIPNKLQYDIDIICWGPVAKILTNDGQIAMLTVVENETAWIPVCLEHYLKEMNLSEIKALHNHIIQFDITDHKEKAAGLVKNEKITLNLENIKDNKVFTEIKVDGDEIVQWKDPESLENMMKNIVMRCVNVPRDEPISCALVPDNCDVFYQTIKKLNTGEDVECRDFVFSCSPQERQKSISIGGTSSSKVTKNKLLPKSVASKKVKEKKTVMDKVTIKVPAEIFFTESSPTTYGMSCITGFMKSTFISVVNEKLLTRAQKLVLNPLVVKIKKINNLPVSTLKKAGVETIYASYNIPYIAYCETVKKAIDTKVVFNEAHMHFSDTVSKIKVIEFMQTQKFFVEIYGNINAPEIKPKCSLFGEEEDDKDISKISPSFQHFERDEGKSDTKVILAVASFDVSSLIENVWDFKEKAQCHLPNITATSRPREYSERVQYIDMQTANEINIVPRCKRQKYILTEEELIKYGTTLKVEVYLMAPQAASLILHQIPRTFKRIFMVINNWELAKSVFTDIAAHNENSLRKRLNLKNTDLANSEILTGFLVDNGNNFFFYLEGPSTGFILNIWHEMNTCDVSMCRIFFNTDNAFEKRLYMQFISDGVYVVTLKIPFHDILAKSGLYCGKTPPPCMEALNRLALLFESSHYRCVLQQNLLPTAGQLISLNLEWGVPLRWKEKIDS